MDDDAAASKSVASRIKSLRYRIPSTSVFMTVLQACFDPAGAPAAFAHHLGARKGAPAGKGGRGGEATVPAPRVPLSEYTGWKRLDPLLRSFFAATLELLSQATDGSMLLYVLRGLRAYIPFLQPYERLVRRYVKTLAKMFGAPPATLAAVSVKEATGASATSAESAVRLAAFFRLRQMASALPHPTIDLVMKGAYMAYVRNAKFMSETTVPGVLLMSNCIAELCGVDETAAYQHAFVYLRQLALHLRAALTTQTKESVQTVYGWQFVNCLRVWSATLARHATDPSRPLFQLVYPLVQVALGTARLITTARHFPLRCHIAAMLNDVAWATGVYIPTLPLVTEVLRHVSHAPKPKGAAPTTPPVLSLMLRASDAVMATRAYSDALVQRCLDLVFDGAKVNYCSVAFPELILPITASLRAFAKATSVGAWRARARAICDAFAGQSAKIAAKRAALKAAPADREALAAWMSAEIATQRAERAAAREAAAASQLADAQAKALAAAAAGGGAGGGEADDDGADAGVESGAADMAPAPAPASKRARVDSAGKQQRSGGSGGGGGGGGRKGRPGGGRVGSGGGDDLVEDIDLHDL